ncbi:DUF6883 domain-containing protein [Methylobacterium sp. Leaf123]|uniref:DUF6883 domain-containing protein n=1 Tax=Methylobacterium sp. Leaf123 TaxID=1736264 RepID=UPI0012E7362A|nr:DUF6883 domain-containing protein [Methylobacterium sp. Leaf123]
MSDDDAWPARFIVAPAKVTDYLLSADHPEGGPKAAFLKQFGFTAANPLDLYHALISHSQRENFAGTIEGHKALKLYFHGLLFSLTPEQPNVRTVWQLDEGDASRTARFITLKPLPKLPVR